jgi:hypothetical protein
MGCGKNQQKRRVMKLNMLWEFKTNAIECFSLVSIALGFIGLCVVAFWDNIAGFTFSHHQGYGFMQITAMALLGVYIFWGVEMFVTWREK